MISSSLLSGLATVGLILSGSFPLGPEGLQQPVLRTAAFADSYGTAPSAEAFRVLPSTWRGGPRDHALPAVSDESRLAPG